MTGQVSVEEVEELPPFPIDKSNFWSGEMSL